MVTILLSKLMVLCDAAKTNFKPVEFFIQSGGRVFCLDDLKQNCLFNMNTQTFILRGLINFLSFWEMILKIFESLILTFFLFFR